MTGPLTEEEIAQIEKRAFQISCPYCGAKAQELCRTRTTSPFKYGIRYCHEKRWQRAINQLLDEEIANDE